jgi:DNA-binding transcriptional MerR regulator
MSNQRLLTTAEVAERAEVDVRTVARWANAGRLKPSVQFPGLRGPRMFDADDVERFIADLKRSA